MLRPAVQTALAAVPTCDTTETAIARLQSQLQEMQSKRAKLFEHYLDHKKNSVVLRLVTCGNNFISGEHAFANNNLISIKDDSANNVIEVTFSVSNGNISLSQLVNNQSRVNATTGLVFNNNNQKQKLADGTKRQSSGIRSNNLSGSVQLNWTVFDGFKMFATRDKLSQFVLLGELNIKNQIINSVAAVINNYYTLEFV